MEYLEMTPSNIDKRLEETLSKFATHVYSPRAPVASSAFDQAISAIKEVFREMVPREKEAYDHLGVSDSWRMGFNDCHKQILKKLDSK